MSAAHKIWTLLMGLFISQLTFASPLEMTSDDFLDKGVLPVLYTCDGKGVPPQLTWTAPSKAAQSYILILSSKGKNEELKYHWVLYNLPSGLTKLPELKEKLPDGSKVARNSWGNTTYHSPCPDRGSVQSYLFTLYALNKKMNFQADATPETILAEIKNSIVEKGNITAVYSRWPQPLN